MSRAVTHTFVTRPGPYVGNCASCGQFDDDMAEGFCFDCCAKGEERAAKRSVVGHLFKGLSKLFRPRKWVEMRINFSWAWERLTRTGDYAKGGTFDREGYDWR